MGKYDGKNVVITGGSSGFGLATAKILLNEGARVLITGRAAANLRSLSQQLGPALVTVQSDAGSLPDIDALAQRVRDEFGTLDALVVNAGIAGFAPFEATTEQLYDQVFDVNGKGPYFTVQRLAPLLAAGSGIVLTTSIANVLGHPMVSAYAASKAALRSMARTMARELLDRNIRVNAVSPGPIDTGILERSMPEEAAAQTKASMTADNPMGRFGHPDEVAATILFLAFEATYTTGAEIPVDGGASQL